MVVLKKLELFFSDTQLVYGMLFGIAMLIIYYVVLYQRFNSGGMMSKVPREAPPRRLSPAAARFLWIKGFDSDCLIAGILSAVIKSCYTIKWRRESFSIVLLNPALRRALSGDERAALTLGNRQLMERLSISKDKNRFTNRAENRMKAYLHKHYGKWLVNKWIFVGIGIAASLLIIVINAIFSDPQYFTEILVYNIVLLPLFIVSLLAVRFAYSTRNYTAMAIPLVLLAISGISMLFFEINMNRLFIFYALPFIIVNMLAYRFLPAYTPEGKKVSIELLEFRHYLLSKFKRDPQLDETEIYLLPYLIALEVQFAKETFFSNLLTGVKAQEKDLFMPFR